MIFDEDDYYCLSSLFDSSYPGYRPTVKEVPNGDGNVDAEKRYLHVALKYNPPAFAVEYLARAHFEACRVAEALGVRPEFYPRVADGTLRVLDYPPGAGSAEHTDFDLFTILCWRSTPGDLVINEGEYGNRFPPYYDNKDPSPVPLAALTIDPHLHIGELGELVGLGPATPHKVIARSYRQHSIVYFAMPDHKAMLPRGKARCGVWGCEEHGGLETVGSWLKERLARSRVYG